MGMEAVELLRTLPGSRVLCVGDVMLDRYVYGEASRISPEAPVPVVHVRRQVSIPGGAGNVAKNLAAFGIVPHMASVVGDDANADMLREHLETDIGPGLFLFRDATRPTIVKTRIIAGIQQVVRFDEEKQSPISSEAAGRLIAAVERLLDDARAVAVSDYGKGVMTPEMTQALIRAAAARKRPVAIDPKGYDYAKYAGADLVKPNRKELGEAIGREVREDADIAEAARTLMRRHAIKNLLVTLSDRGMLLFREADGGETPFLMPSKAKEVFDVTGAGDTVLASMAGAMAVGSPLELGARLATLAAGVVVGKVGTATASPEEIEKAARDEET